MNPVSYVALVASLLFLGCAAASFIAGLFEKARNFQQGFNAGLEAQIKTLSITSDTVLVIFSDQVDRIRLSKLIRILKLRGAIVLPDGYVSDLSDVPEEHLTRMGLKRIAKATPSEVREPIKIKIAWPTTYVDLFVHIVWEHPFTKEIKLFKHPLKANLVAEPPYAESALKTELTAQFGEVVLEDCGNWKNLKELDGTCEHPFQPGVRLSVQGPCGGGNIGG